MSRARKVSLCAIVTLTIIFHSNRSHGRQDTSSGAGARESPSPSRSNPQFLFRQGEAALKEGDLERAERSFRGVLRVDPAAAGAYGNLGVVYMRRKQWPRALAMLEKATNLAPNVSGFRLNIGLVYYRQNNFHAAITPFESVVQDGSGTSQARYLLGLCYFLTERYADAASTLESLWEQESGQPSYLYVLGIAASKAKRPDLERRAQTRLVEIGQDSAEFHLFMGKGLIHHEEYDKAIAELEQAAGVNPKLSFVHFNLGLAYLGKRDMPHARAEFMKDIAIEPDVAANYDRLGLIFYLEQNDRESEAQLLKAIHLDRHAPDTYYQLARLYRRQKKYALALREINLAVEFAPSSVAVHYIRGQLLKQVGRQLEAQTELLTVTKLEESTDRGEAELETGPTPEPELADRPE